MSVRIECHLLKPLPKIRQWLRRYSNSETGKLEEVLRKKSGLSSGKCPTYGYCNGQFLLGEIDYEPKTIIEAAPERPHDDPRWPKVCDTCGKPFKDTDHWQVFQEALYERFNGEIIVLRDAQPGDMWDCWWYPDVWKANSPDGMMLAIKMPNGHEFSVDSSGTDGTRWSRIGVPPKITVTPSVLFPGDGFHAWVNDGFIIEV